jgi:histone-lysine N-methyltransferase SETMAR
LIFFLLHDNAPAHSAAIIRQFLTQKQIVTLNHLSYLPDLSPSDYFLFPKVKMQLKGARFDTIEGIQKTVTDQLNKISAEDFSNAMKKLETRANLCITSNGSYFE